MVNFNKDRNIFITLSAEKLKEINKVDNEYYNYFKNIYDFYNDINFMAFCFEISDKTNKYKHFHCYIQCSNQHRKTSIKNMFKNNTINIQHQKGDTESVINYLWKGQYEKEGTKYPQPSAIYCEWGEKVKYQGYRTDLLSIKKLIENGVSDYDICNTVYYTKKDTDKKDPKLYFNQYIQGHNFFQKYRGMHLDEIRERRKKLNCFIIFGDPGTGKTEYILDKYGFKNVYILENPNGDNKNWNGYNNQSILLIDEFNSWLPITTMNKICDNKPFKIRMLNAISYAKWSTVFIISQFDPFSWWSEAQNNGKGQAIEAFFTRIKKCLKVTRGNTGTLVTQFVYKDVFNDNRHNHKQYLSDMKVEF